MSNGGIVWGPYHMQAAWGDRMARAGSLVSLDTWAEWEEMLKRVSG